MINKHFVECWLGFGEVCVYWAKQGWAWKGDFEGGGGVEGSAGLLWDPSYTDTQPFVVSLTVCFQTALCVHCGFTHRTVCAEKTTHCIFESNKKRDEKVEIIHRRK